jgi:hypothetical protein
MTLQNGIPYEFKGNPTNSNIVVKVVLTNLAFIALPLAGEVDKVEVCKMTEKISHNDSGDGEQGLVL